MTATAGLAAAAGWVVRDTSDRGNEQDGAVVQQFYSKVLNEDREYRVYLPEIPVTVTDLAEWSACRQVVICNATVEIRHRHQNPPESGIHHNIANTLMLPDHCAPNEVTSWHLSKSLVDDF
jgi:hypothetical protein